MKKFIGDNITIIVIITLALAGFAVYKTMSKKKDEETPKAV